MSKLNYYYDKPILTFKNTDVLEEYKQTEKIKCQNNIITYGIMLLLATATVISFYSAVDRDYYKTRTAK